MKCRKCLSFSYKTFGLTAQSINDVTSMDKSVRIESDTKCIAKGDNFHLNNCRLNYARPLIENVLFY